VVLGLGVLDVACAGASGTGGVGQDGVRGAGTECVGNGGGMQDGAEVVDVVLLREALLVLVRCVCCCNALERTVALQYTATHYCTLQQSATPLCRVCLLLQYTATQCSVARHCSTLQHAATSPRQVCLLLQHNATHCSVAPHCSTLQHTETPPCQVCLLLQHTATHCSAATHCRTL